MTEERSALMNAARENRFKISQPIDVKREGHHIHIQYKNKFVNGKIDFSLNNSKEMQKSTRCAHELINKAVQKICKT